MEDIIQLVLDAALLTGLVLLVGWLVTRNAEGTSRRAGYLALVFIVIGLMASLSAVLVSAGTVGVVTAFGQVQAETLPPGLHFRVPFVNVVHEITTRVQPHPFAEIDAASSEYQTVRLTGVMNYHVDGSLAADLYQRVGEGFAEKVLDPAFNDFIKTVVPTYSISEILPKRDEIRTLAKQQLQENVRQYGIIIDDIYLANIAFSPEYEAAIEAKQVANQQVQTEQQVLSQKRIVAEQNVVSAKGLADANIETAKGQSEANRLLTESLTPELIQYTLIQKLGPTIQTILLPSDQQFILDPKALAPVVP